MILVGDKLLSEEECAILDDIFDDVKPYLSQEGLEVIEKTGLFTVGQDGDLETPLIEGRACAYSTTTENGTLHCGIEQAQRDGEISWKKPISLITSLKSLKMKSFVTAALVCASVTIEFAQSKGTFHFFFQAV